MKTNLILLTLLIIILTLIACRPDTFKFVVIPAEDAAQTREQWKAMTDYLSDGLGQTVELVTVADYTSAIEAMKYGHADMARLSAAGYVMAIDEGVDVEPLVAGVKMETGLPGYYAMLIALTETDISDLGSLTFAFVDVGSTSGYILPSLYLKKVGVDPKLLFTGSHNASILALLNGSVDVVAVASNRVETAVKEGIMGESEFQVVWRSELVPNVPIVVQADLPKSTKDRLASLFVNMPEEIVLAAMTNESGYVEVSDETYDTVRQSMGR